MCCTENNEAAWYQRCQHGAKSPVTRNFDVFFYLRLNKRLSKQSWGGWFETLLCSLWRHRNAPVTKQHHNNSRFSVNVDSIWSHVPIWNWKISQCNACGLGREWFVPEKFIRNIFIPHSKYHWCVGPQKTTNVKNSSGYPVTHVFTKVNSHNLVDKITSC